MHTSIRPLGGTTIAASILHFVVCGLAAGAIALFGFIVMLMSVWAADPDDQGAIALLGAGIVVIAIVGLGFATWCGVGTLRRRAWARWTVLGIQLALFSSFGSLLRAQAGPLPMLAMLLPLATVVLLLVPRTAADFEHAT